MCVGGEAVAKHFPFLNPRRGWLRSGISPEHLLRAGSAAFGSPVWSCRLYCGRHGAGRAERPAGPGQVTTVRFVEVQLAGGGSLGQRK